MSREAVENTIEFNECSNYRGKLQAKKENGLFYWRVDCDFDFEPWSEIPAYLWDALEKMDSELTAITVDQEKNR